MSEEVMNHKAAYHQKMNALFGEILKSDWEPDKSYDLKSGGKTVIIRYVTLSKMKRNIAPLLFNSGLIWDISFSDAQIIGENMIVKAFITFTDVSTGYSETYTSTGMSAKGEKALQIAQSFAVKTYLTNKFMIIDGADPDREDLESPVRSGKSFTLKGMDEVNEIKSKIQDNAMKTDEQKSTAPVQNAPKEEIIVDMGAVEAKPGMTDNIGYIMSPIEVRTVGNIVTKWDEKLKKGDITPEKYKEMDDARLYANSHEAVLDFIRKYKVV